MAAPTMNWAGNLTYQARACREPATLDELQALVAEPGRLKALGTRHSFNGIGGTTATHISLARLNRIGPLDATARSVTIEPGVRYGELGAFLHCEGSALHNLASLPHISVAGAVATATHGSGDKLGNLATAVAGFDLLTADGNIRHFSRTHNPDTFVGAVVHLGALGIVTRLILDVEPTYCVSQLLFEDLLWKTATTEFDAIMSSATSVSLFTDWQAPRFHQVWLKQRLRNAEERLPDRRDFFGARPAAADRHPLPAHAALNCTPQMGVAGPWHERLPHFRLEFTPSSGAELQSEYFVPRRHAPAALTALAELRSEIAPHVHVTEIRTIAADEFWLSPAYRQSSAAIHFTWKPHAAEVNRLLPRIEERLQPFGVRPHWGKLFTLTPAEIRARYPRWQDFLHLRRQLDPAGRFQNSFLDALFEPPA